MRSADARYLLRLVCDHSPLVRHLNRRTGALQPVTYLARQPARKTRSFFTVGQCGRPTGVCGEKESNSASVNECA